MHSTKFSKSQVFLRKMMSPKRHDGYSKGVFTLNKKIEVLIKHFFSKCDQIRRKLWIWPQLLKKSLTLFRMGLFGAAHGWGWDKKDPLPKICCTYPAMMKLGKLIP